MQLLTPQVSGSGAFFPSGRPAGRTSVRRTLPRVRVRLPSAREVTAENISLAWQPSLFFLFEESDTRTEGFDCLLAELVPADQ